jgi:hypothetical protein
MKKLRNYTINPGKAKGAGADDAGDGGRQNAVLDGSEASRTIGR